MCEKNLLSYNGWYDLCFVIEILHTQPYEEHTQQPHTNYSLLSLYVCIHAAIKHSVVGIRLILVLNLFMKTGI